ncbi:MAG: CinA family protein [Thermotogae bacterium]|nr:CinA family protein [Thermotogota bacterium]
MRDDLLRLKDVLVGGGFKVATAESCTGGSLAHLLTSIPGSSEYYVGGVVAYSVEAKIRILGVDPDLIERYTVYSEVVVESMAEGVKDLLKSDIAVATSGEFNGKGYFLYCIIHPKGKEIGKVSVIGDRVTSKEEAVSFLIGRLLDLLKR